LTLAHLTNTAVNKQADGVDLRDITRSLDSVLPQIGPPDSVMDEVGRAVVRTVIAALPAMLRGCAEAFADGAEHCFQIFGFDVLFARDRRPLVLEVNYRPSLAFGTEEERQLKVRVLLKAAQIANDVRAGKKTLPLGRFVQICPDSRSADAYKAEIAESLARARPGNV
jgi:hypothetical protein